jgi:hypothetical protein
MFSLRKVISPNPLNQGRQREVSREAICMAVLPDQGLAGLAVNAQSGSESERAEIAVLKDGTSRLRLADTDGSERAMLLVQGASPAQLLVLDHKVKTKLDVLLKIRSGPDAMRHLLTICPGGPSAELLRVP